MTYFFHSELRAVSRDLREHAHLAPPTYLQVCAKFGFDATATAINDWNADGKPGHYSDYADGDWTWARKDGGDGHA
jgi:hypothetical protein